MKSRTFSKFTYAALATSALVIGNFVALPATHAVADDHHTSHSDSSAHTRALKKQNERSQRATQPSAKFDLGATITSNDQKITLKERDQANKAWYRIPALTATPGGDLLAAFDERPLSVGDTGKKYSPTGFNGENWLKLLGTRKWKNGEDSPNPNYIMQYRSKNNGKTWEPDGYICEGVASGDREKISGCSDPSYVVDWETGTIFNFHVRSYRAGLQESQKGNDHDNRDIVQVEVSKSSDDGKTWTSEIMTRSVTADQQADWRFASSGQGIQLTHPKHSGWLIQQFTRQDNTAQRAFSLISKDHGKTWQAGQPIGTEMDENKVVELSNGDLLLTSRNVKGPGNYDGVSDNPQAHRWQALSSDGGFTWSKVTQMPDVKEGKTNGQIIRAFPLATPENPAAKVLLYAGSAAITERNTKNENNDRSKGTIYLSCDDGTSWTQKKVFNEGTTGYITIAIQHDGRIGMLTEDGSKDGYKDYGIYYRNFDIDYVGQCPGVKEYLNEHTPKVSPTPTPTQDTKDSQSPAPKDTDPTGTPDKETHPQSGGKVTQTPTHPSSTKSAQNTALPTTGATLTLPLGLSVLLVLGGAMLAHRRSSTHN
ncbi:sialidase family protein [Arcanobacterium canis]